MSIEKFYGYLISFKKRYSFNKRGKKMPFDNRRAHIRSDFHLAIEYVLNPDTTGEIYRGITVNISESGLCLNVYNELCAGQEILIKSSIRGSFKKGIVHWYNKLNDNLFNVGLHFI